MVGAGSLGVRVGSLEVEVATLFWLFLLHQLRPEPVRENFMVTISLGTGV